MEVKPERIAEIIRKIDPNNNMSVSELADAIMQDLEKDRKLSDLEIVQQALEHSRMDLCCKGGKLYLYNDVGEPSSYIFDTTEALLTWAKQTINGG